MRISNTTIHIVCTIDNGFKIALSAMLISLFESNKRHCIKIHLLSADLSVENVAFFNNLTHRYKQQFQFYRLKFDQFINLPVDERITYAAYYRLVAPEVLDKEVERFIYLDADMIIKRDLFELWNTDLKGNIIGAIYDIFAIRDKYYHTHNIDDKYMYFNSGVLLVDIKEWLTFNTTKKTIKYITDNKKLCLYHDQDGLNGILHNRSLPLSPEWNQQIGIYVIDPGLLSELYGENNFKMALEHPAAVHFNGKEKPWWFVCQHPCKKQFIQCLKKSGLPLKYQNVSFKNFLKLWRYKLLGWKYVNKRIFNP